MTVAYTCWLSSVTLVIVLLPWAGLAAIVTGTVLAAAVEPYWAGVVVAGAGLLALAVGLLLRQRDAMTTIRAGAWPALGRGDRRPHTHDDFLDAVEALGNERFDVVGGGWTFWMNRRGAKRPRLFTDQFHGYDPVLQLWRCGSTIYEMEAYYKRKCFAFPTFPTNGTIALGSWIACENHGNSGDLTGPSHTPFNKVILLDRLDPKSGTVEFTMKDVPHPVPAARKFMQQQPGRYVIMYAGIDEQKLIDFTDESETLQYRMKEIRNADDAQHWLKLGAALRWLFVGSGRTYGIGVRMVGRKSPEWQKNATHRPFPMCCVERRHVEPHCCSVSCRYFQTDPCSYVCGWHEPEEAWDGYTSRLHANDWYPNMWWPAVTLGGVLLGVYNFEIFFIAVEFPLNGNWLWSLLKDLIALFQTHRGRCEVRCSNKRVDSWVCLDCGIASKWFGPQIFSEPYRILHKHGVEVVANHTGKYLPPDKYLSGDGWRVRRVASHDLVAATNARRI